MSKIVNFVCSPEEAKNTAYLAQRIREELGLEYSTETNLDFRWRKRSIDARQKQIKINASFEVEIASKLPSRFSPQIFDLLHDNPKVVHIIGAGPAGISGSLTAKKLGLSSITFEQNS